MKAQPPSSAPTAPWFILVAAALTVRAPELRAQEPAPMVQVRGTVQKGPARVWFGPGSAALDDDDLAVLREVALAMADHPEILRVAALGHGSTDEAARALGLRRAEAVHDGLVALGVDPARLEVGSWGAERGHDRVVELVVCDEGRCALPP